jgi:hypothetical protein
LVVKLEVPGARQVDRVEQRPSVVGPLGVPGVRQVGRVEQRPSVEPQAAQVALPEDLAEKQEGRVVNH